MKTSITILFVLFTAFLGAQINHSYLTQKWCNCWADSIKTNTDTLYFASNTSACITRKIGKRSIYVNEKTYHFFANDSLTIDLESGSIPNPDYIPDTMYQTISIDTTFNEKKEMTITILETQTPILTYYLGRAFMASISTYHLYKRRNILVINDMDWKESKKRKFKILELSQHQMILKEI